MQHGTPIAEFAAYTTGSARLESFLAFLATDVRSFPVYIRQHFILAISIHALPAETAAS